MKEFDPKNLSEYDGIDGRKAYIAFIPIISVVGWFGATMTFPLEKD